MTKYYRLILSLAGFALVASSFMLADTAAPIPDTWPLQDADWPRELSLRWPPFVGRHYVPVSIGFENGLALLFVGSILVAVFSTYWVAVAFLRRKTVRGRTPNTKVS